MFKFSKHPRLVIIIICATIILSGPSQGIKAEKGKPSDGGKNNSEERENSASVDGIIPINNSDWYDFSQTEDCAYGWGINEWQLTLSQPKTVEIKVDDCCCPGDYYSIFVNDKLLGTTPKPSVWGCDYSGNLSSGVFNLFLPIGTHVIKIQDDSFLEHTPEEIAKQRMCPAGFEIWGTLYDPPSSANMTLENDSWEFYNNTSPYQPENIEVSIIAKNVGTIQADNVVVRFYDGNPDQGGIQISEHNLGTIQANDQKKASILWTLNGNLDNRDLYARVFSNSDIDLGNNTIHKTLSLWYIPFEHDEDAFSFENWGIELQDILNDLRLFIDFYHPDDLLVAQMLPIVYPLWSLLLEKGGHCFGMSSTSSLYYQYPEIKPVPKTAYAMDKEEVRSDIQYYQRQQITIMLELMMMDILGYNEQKQYEYVQSEIKEHKKPIMLLMQTEGENGGHAVLAYKILDLGNEKRLYIYDNNYPIINLTSNLYTSVYKDNYDFYYDTPTSTYYDKYISRKAQLTIPDGAEVILEKLYKWILSQIQQSGLIRVVFSPTADGAEMYQGITEFSVKGTASVIEPIISDQYDRRIGYVDGSFINEIPGATYIIGEDFEVYDIPDDLEYTLGTEGIVDANYAMTFVIPKTSVSTLQVDYFNIPASPGSVTSVNLSIDNTNWTLSNTGQEPQEPDSITETYFHKSYLPLIKNGNQVCGSQIIINPDFEQGNNIGWSKFSATGRELINTNLPSSIYPHSGNWAAWLGNNDDEVSEINQIINPPNEATSASLSYWYWIDSNEYYCIYDFAWLEVNGGVLRLYNLCDDGNTSGWAYDTVNLTPYLGQTLNLKFHVDTDYVVESNMYIDDVKVEIQCDN